MEINRRPFQGVLNILSFNRHFYFAGVSLLMIICISRYFVDWNAATFWLLIVAFLYGLLMPLVVSAYVYDFSGFYKFKWLDEIIKDDGSFKKMININAGFDETSFIIKSKFKNSDLQVFDFYNDKQHTEPAIKRARKVSITYPGTQQISSSSFPVNESSIDLIFLLSAVHEIRTQKEKVVFLKECKRIADPNATVVMVEHLRDFPNFVAFTIGFTHFFSRRTWKKAFVEAGFSSFNEKKFTPFMSVFICQP